MIISFDSTAAPGAGAADDGAGAVAGADHFVEAGPVDRLHEPVLIAARHPDQRRRPRAPPWRPGSAKSTLRASFAPASSHIFTELSPASATADDCGSTADDRVLPAGEFQRSRHDRVGRSAAADRDDRAGTAPRALAAKRQEDGQGSDRDGHGADSTAAILRTRRTLTGSS